MFRLVSGFFAAVLLSSCVTMVRQEDLNAWQGVQVIELESHPLFASIRPEFRQLSDGSRLYIYFNGGTGTTDKGDVSFTNRRGCSNQFLVKDGIVVRYTPVGVGGMRCFTNCAVRPASRPCGGN